VLQLADKEFELELT